MTPPRVSAIIITKNEAARITPCLESLRWVDELIVVDDESTDDTRHLCEQFGARVLIRRSHGDFDQQRNAGIGAASGEWILQLDADEVIPASLRDEIRRVIDRPSAVGYRIRRANYFLGHEMRHGGWTWNEVKLFRKEAARYIGHSVHETLHVDGPVGQLASPIRHYPFQSLTQCVERQNFYTSVEARLLRQSHPTLGTGRLRRQLLLRPLKLFWKSYVKKGGWREGMHGLVFAAFFAWVEFLKCAKYWAQESSELRVQSSELKKENSQLSTRNSQLVTDGRETLSVVVLTKNEEARIARCLESVRWADELIVVDGGSTDRTVDICQSLGAKVIHHPFEGSFAVDRNLGLARARRLGTAD
jgi:glycosyltransferase involved in cell wall biosynthesis